jgi:hypothetical protein
MLQAKARATQILGGDCENVLDQNPGVKCRYHWTTMADLRQNEQVAHMDLNHGPSHQFEGNQKFQALL